MTDPTEAAAMIAGEQTFRLTGTPMCVAEVSGRVLCTNRAFEGLFGAATGRTLPSLFVDVEEQREMAAGLRQTVDSPSDFGLEGTCAGAAGVDVVVSWSLRSLDRLILAEAREAKDATASTAVIARRDLARKSGEFESILRALSEVYLRTDGEGRIVEWYGGQERAVAARAEEFLGRRPQDIVPVEVAPLIASAMARTLGERTSVTVEYDLSTPAGDEHFEARFVPCLEDQVTAIIRNVSALRRAEAALHASEERLRTAHKMEAIGRLAGGVAHDFNNQLTVVLGRLQMLQRSAGLKGNDRAHVYEAAEAASRAATLTRRLLALSRRQVLVPTLFDLNDVVAEMHGTLAHILGDPIEVTTELDDSIGPIRSEQAEVEQIILNLSLNARDAMPEGGRLTLSTREVTLDPEQANEREDARPGRYVVLAVTDTGCGMKREVIEHLFEPFFTTKPRDQGTGLGLATVAGIVKQSGGHIVVQSRLGAGTTLEVCLPRATTSSMGSKAAAVTEGAAPRAVALEFARERRHG